MSLDLPSFAEPSLTVHTHGPGEWIAGVTGDGPALHVYQLDHGDWLVSEVGGDRSGRGMDLRCALAALAAEIPPRRWWQAVVQVFEPDAGSAASA